MELSNRFSPVRSPGLIAVARRFVFVAGLLAASAAFGAITDKQTADPFSSFNVTNAGSVEFTISFTDSHGTFPLSPGFTKSVVSGTAHYHHTATTPGSAENFLQNLTYNPVENRIPHGTTEDTVFTLEIVDATSTNTFSFTLTVVPVNDAPTVSFSNPDPADITDKQTSLALAQVNVGDVDAGDAVVSTVTFPDVRGSFPTSAGFTKGLSGLDAVYTLSSRTAANAQTFLRALVFTPTENRIPIDEDETTTFSVTVTDSSNAVDTASETLKVTPVNDPPRLLGNVLPSTPDNQSVRLFAAMSIEEVDVDRVSGVVTNQYVTLTVSNGWVGGALSSIGSYQGYQNPIVLNDTAARVTATLTNILFVPVANLLPVGQSNVFSVQFLATDSVANSPDNFTTNVAVISVNDPPTIAASVTPNSTPDTQEALPFRLTVNDPDVNDNNFTVGIRQLTPTLSFGTLSPAVPISGGKAVVESGVAGVRFTPIQNLATNVQPVVFRISVTNGTDVASADVTLNVIEVNNQANISGVTGSPTSPIPINDDQTALPFSGVTISDVDRGGNQPVIVRLSLDDPAKGTLTPPGPLGPLTNLTPAAVSAAIHGVLFTPTPNRVPVNSSELVTFTIRVHDIYGLERVNNQTTYQVKSVNGAPQINNVSSVQPLSISPQAPVKPFGAHPPYTTGVTVVDDDTNVTATVSLDIDSKGVLTNLGGFTNVSPGLYRMFDSPAAITMALTNLEFVVSTNYPFTAGLPGDTTFTITVKDGVLNQPSRTLRILLQEDNQNLMVTRTEDDGAPGSLRHAVANAKNGDMITFALPEYPALLRIGASGPIDLNRHLTLKGPGANLLAISGDSDGNGTPDTQIFRIHATVGIEGLTLTKGAGATSDTGPATGGAIYVAPGGALTIRYCAVTDSRAGQWGGGIDVDGGALTMENCLVRGNEVDSNTGLGGGGVSIYTDAACSFVNTTFSANRQRSANGYGGGAIYAENQTPGTELGVWLTHLTFADNQDAADLGSAVAANVFGTYVFVRNCIFADAGGRNLEVQGAADLFSDGGNVARDSTQTLLTLGGQPQLVTLLDHASDLVNTNAGLAAFNPNLSPTAGYPLANTSAAKGRVANSPTAIDQLGDIRRPTTDSGAIAAATRSHLVVNEVQFDAPASGPDFVEIYADLTAVNLDGYKLWVDGTNRFTFPSGFTVQPGRGVIVADTNLFAGSSNLPTMVFYTNLIGGALNLSHRSRVQLTTSNGLPLVDFRYLGKYFDPEDPTNQTKYNQNSITLAPQFRGFALLPHKTVKTPPLGGANRDGTGAPNSPGRDTAETPFGSPNSFPLITQDQFVLAEDLLATLDVLGNDLDANFLDQKVVVNIAKVGGLGGAHSETNSTEGANVKINPVGSPLRGTEVTYDPRQTPGLQSLAEGARRTDTFYYTIVDIGVGEISNYAATNGGARTLITSGSHRLTNGEPIVITGAGTNVYNNTFAVTNVTDDTFVITVPFAGNPAEKGSWTTIGTRMPTEPRETNVVLTILGVNDYPTPANDLVATDEETILRIMGDPNYAGSTNTVFDSDPLFPLPRRISQVNVLANDSDPDTDDNNATLKVIGVLSSVHAITDFSGINGESPVTVSSAAHGLADGTEVLISGYLGHPSYNGYHVITLIDSNTFSMDIPFVDHNPTNGAVWALLNDANRLNATSELGAAVFLEIRADRQKTCVVFNPRASAYLNGTALGETNVDSFYYAVQDGHAAITLAKVSVNVAGVDDAPVLGDDPGSVGGLNPFVSDSNSLAQVLTDIRALYHLPPASGASGRSDVQVLLSNATINASFRLLDMFTTDEDSALDIAEPDLLENDSDVDRSDVLSIKSVAAFSHAGAALALDTNGPTVVYDPSGSLTLNALAREELEVDFFSIVVTDSRGSDVTNLVSVLVVGVNDTPVALDDNSSTFEDVAVSLNPVQFPTNAPGLHDSDADINGRAPDNRLSLVPVTNIVTVGGSVVNITGNAINYDPTGSALLNSLAHTQSYVDTFEYTVMDGSFIFANDDLFKVDPDGEGFQLDVLANDRNYTGQGNALQIIAVGTPSAGGSVVNDGLQLIYTPLINFARDEVFTYTVSDGNGYEDTALVTVRVTVDPENGHLQANDDFFSSAKNESSVLDVLANDGVRPTGGAGFTIVTNSPLSAGGNVVLAGSTFIYTPDPATTNTYPYHETFTYEISGGGPARATAFVDILVINRENTLTIRDDSFSVAAGSLNNTLDVLLNDNILPASGADLILRWVDTNGLSGIVRIDDAGKALIYTPKPGFIGGEILTYVAADELGGTGSGQVFITIGDLGTCSDFFVVPFETNAPPVQLDVLVNDFVLQGTVGSNVTIVAITPSTTNPVIGSLVISGDGRALLFGPPTQTGEQEFDYTITDGAGRTADGHLTINVVSFGVKANSDNFAVGTGSAGNVLTVLANDRAVPDLGRTLTVVSIGTGLDAPNHGGAVSIGGANNQLIYTPAPGFVGEETFTYTMTDAYSTDTARVVIKVTDGDLVANGDAFSVFLEYIGNSTTLRSFNLPVLVNDRAIPDLGQLLSITTVGPDATLATNPPSLPGLISIAPDGVSLTYTPRETNGTPYVERFAYEITDGTTRRAAGVVVVEVQQRVDVHELDTRDDIFSVAADSSGNQLAVLANDNVKPATANGWNITAISARQFGGLAQISGTNIIYTPANGFIGTDSFTYSVSDGLGGTATAEVWVKVGYLPVADDLFTVISESTNNALDVLANDAVRHAVPTNYVLLDVFGDDLSFASRANVASNVVYYTPDPATTNAFPYVEEFYYRVVDNSGGTVTGRVAVTVYEAGNDRDNATLFMTVLGVNDAPTIAGAGAADTITDKQTVLLFPNVTIGEVDAQGLQGLHVAVTLDQARGFITNLGDFFQTGPGTYEFNGTAAAATTAIRALVYDPIENRIPVPTSETTRFTIAVTDGIIPVPVTDTNTVVTVIAVNDPPVISGAKSNLLVYQYFTIKPFPAIVITEVDDLTLQPLVVTVTLNDPTHGFLNSLGGFVDLGAGVYRLGMTNAGVTAATAVQTLRTLVFYPTTTNRVTPTAPETTRFAITVEDQYAAPVSDANTTVIAMHEFQTKVFPNDGITGDNLGAAVAATRDLVVAGAPQADLHGNNSGAAYIYNQVSLTSTQWTQFQKLVPADGAAGDNFGNALAISGTTIAIAAHASTVSNRSSGSVYIYERTTSSNTWTLARKVAPFDGANGDDFGFAVALHQDTLVVGAHLDDDNGTSSGTVFVFQRHQGGSNNWGLVKKLIAGDAAAGDEFGYSVAVEADTIVVGAYNDVQAGIATGSAYVFSRNQGGTNNWGQVKKLVPFDGLSTDNYGNSVGVEGDIAVVGANRHDHPGNDTGTVYVYERDLGGAGNYGLRKELLSPTALNNDQFGYAIALSREKLVVGAPFSGFDNQSKYGAAWAYARHTGGMDNWGLLQKLERTDAGNNDQFGIAMGLGQDTAVVGASFTDPLGNDSGSIYIYRLKYDNAPLLANPIPDQPAYTNVPFAFTVANETFGDPDVTDLLVLSATLADNSPLPVWLTFNPATGSFSGTPPLAGTYVIRVYATDQDGQTVYDDFTLTISGSNPAALPVILQVWKQVSLDEVYVGYDRPLGADSSDYILEVSQDLVNWSPVGAGLLGRTIVPLDELTEHVTERIGLQLGVTAEFFRMRIQ